MLLWPDNFLILKISRVYSKHLFPISILIFKEEYSELLKNKRYDISIAYAEKNIYYNQSKGKKHKILI